MLCACYVLYVTVYLISLIVTPMGKKEIKSIGPYQASIKSPYLYKYYSDKPTHQGKKKLEK